jgi:prolyl oligopeptidase
MRRLTLIALCALVAPGIAIAQASRPDTSDRYLWLEEMHGARAMAWVKAENEKTLAVLEKDPRFPGMYKSALAMAQATDRIPYVRFLGGQLYNFWQDSTHVRGIWRRTTLASYRTASPQWTTVLDLDSLARAEKANWVWQGSTCAQPAEERCLLFLSDGGEDANTVREFDVATRRFVQNGFFLPKGKQRVAWTNVDTILVSREWTPGELTSSGYPFIRRRSSTRGGTGSASSIDR